MWQRHRHHMKFSSIAFYIGRILPLGALFCLASCADTERMKTQLKELKATEIELTTDAGIASSEVADSRRKLSEMERTQPGKNKSEDIDAQSERLKARLIYLDSANKALVEQNGALLADLAAYQAQFVQK